MPNQASATTTIRRKLGRGLGSLISAPVHVEVPGSSAPAPPPVAESATPVAVGSTASVTSAPVTAVHPNPKQPRQHFDEQALQALANSISSSGLMQPIVVRPIKSAPSAPPTYQIIAGERRWRAAQLAGLKQIPIVVRDVDDRTAAELSLIENLQREDLNPLERADAFKRLADDFRMSHQEIAQQVGLDRSSVTNHLRLLELDDLTRQALRDGQLSMGHAKALLSITNNDRRASLAAQAVRGGWSVRELERRVKPAANGPAASASESSPVKIVSPATANAADLARRLSEHLGTKVHVQPGRNKGSGKLIIEFYSLDQFEGVLARLQYGGE